MGGGQGGRCVSSKTDMHQIVISQRVVVVLLVVVVIIVGASFEHWAPAEGVTTVTRIPKRRCIAVGARESDSGRRGKAYRFDGFSTIALGARQERDL